MKKPTLLHMAALLACLSLLSCNNSIIDDDVDYTSDRINEYTINWIKTYGLIDPSQDWCTVAAVNADVVMGGKIAKVNIYNDNPAVGGHLIGSTSSGKSMVLDVAEGTEYVYARRTRVSGIVVDEGYYPIVNGKVLVDGVSSKPNKVQSRSRGDGVTYAHTPSYFDAMIVCEDLGSIGDFDFNDIVFGLRHVAGDDPTLVVVPMAAGGVYAANVYFKTDLIGEIHGLIREGAPAGALINTQTDYIGSVSKLKHISISLKDYPGWNISGNWGDMSIEVVGQLETVKITKPTADTAPQMICLGGDWFWPIEKIDLKWAYTGFTTWNCDAGATTWLGSWTEGKVVKWDVPGVEPEDTRMWYKVTTIDNKSYKIRVNGSSTQTTGESGVTYYVDTPWTSCKEMFTVYSDEEAFILNREGNYIWGHPVAANNIKTVEFSDNFDMSDVTNLDFMFAGCASMTSAGVAGWAAKPSSSLTTAESMFKGCKSLSALDLSGWDVSSVNNLYDAFSGCTALKALNLDGWTFASGVDIRYFIEGATGITVTCSAEAEAKMSAETELGSTSVTYARP